jgi:copper chaperone
MNHAFVVTGMTCSHCERAVDQALKSVDPQAHIKIDLPTGKVDVQSVQSREALAKAIVDEGYAVA